MTDSKPLAERVAAYEPRTRSGADATRVWECKCGRICLLDEQWCDRCHRPKQGDLKSRVAALRERMDTGFDRVTLERDMMAAINELSAEVERLRACERIGQLLANLAYNWKHGPNRWLSDDDRAMLAALQKQWDAAIAREAKPS